MIPASRHIAATIVAFAIFFVSASARNTIHVSPKGNDNASGSVLRPVRSLQVAVDKASSMHAEGDSGRTVRIKLAAGTYTQTKGVLFGADDFNLAIEGKGIGETVISGAVVLPQFEVGEDGVWSVNLDPVLPSGGVVEQLYVNGIRAVRARTPNGTDMFVTNPMTELRIDPVPDAEGRRRGFCAQSMRLSADAMAAVEGAAHQKPSQIIINFLHAWDLTRRYVESVSFADSTIVVVGSGMKTWNRMDRCSQFYFENDRSFLDQPGEYFYDESTAILYYMPREGETVDNTVALIPSARNLLIVRGRSDCHARNISFKGISFCHTRYSTPRTGEDPEQAAAGKDAALMVDFADGVSFEDCEVAHTGNSGIWIREACLDCSVKHCYIHDLGIGAVKIGAKEKPDDEDLLLTRRVTLDNNILCGGGRMIHTGVGVTLFQASDCVITHNDVSDFYYSGMSIGWNWGYSHSPSKRNIVRFNHIHHIGWGVLSDMGGVYCLGLSEGTEVSDNVIHDIYSYGYGGWGLYTDEGSTGIKMQRNLVYNCKSSGFHQHYGEGNLISNNIFVNGFLAQLEATRVEDHLSFTFCNNIVCYKEGCMYGIKWDQCRSDVQSNLYWNQAGEVSFNGLTMDEWRSATGKDIGSVIADPCFKDIEASDFTIVDTKAAESIGFVPFDYSQSGVYGSEEWRNLAVLDPARIAEYESVVDGYMKRIRP